MIKTYAIFLAYTCDSEYNVTKLAELVFKGTVHAAYDNEARRSAGDVLDLPSYLLVIKAIDQSTYDRIYDLDFNQKVDWSIVQ